MSEAINSSDKELKHIDVIIVIERYRAKTRLRLADELLKTQNCRLGFDFEQIQYLLKSGPGLQFQPIIFQIIFRHVVL